MVVPRFSPTRGQVTAASPGPGGGSEFVLLAKLLETFGHQTLAVRDGPAALEAVRTFHPEVVLLDLGLPGMDGYEVARRLREETITCSSRRTWRSSRAYSADGTLETTHRILGPTSIATIELDYSAMRDGDMAGLALFRDSSAWIGIKRASGSARVVMVNNLTMDARWNTVGMGTEVAGANVSGGRIWLRIAADIRPGPNRQGRFSYSTDGSQFTELGSAFTMKNAWEFFMGYRYAMFNYATQALGGSIKVPSFELATP